MKVRRANKRLVGDLKVLMHDAEDFLKATAGAAGEGVDEIRAQLGKAVETAKATCDRCQGLTRQAAEATDRIIRKHPYQSFGLAFGAGLLVGVLCRRR